MAFISVTRLRVRSRWRLPFFLISSLRIARQAQRLPAFHGGYLAFSSGFAFWTVTVWDDGTEMRAFRNSGPHVKAMPKLIRWCDEASYAHWESADAGVPEPVIAAEKLVSSGRLSKVRNPTEAQLAGLTWPDEKVPAIVRTVVAIARKP